MVSKSTSKHVVVVVVVDECRKWFRNLSADMFSCFYKSTTRHVVVVIVDEWQNLPADILFLIADRTEIRLLRAVCSSWRSSLPLPDIAPPHPLLLSGVSIPRPLFVEDPHRTTCFNGHDRYPTLTERNIYYLEPLVNDTDNPESWMVKLEERSSGKMRFHNTLSHRCGHFKLPAVVSLFGCRVLLVGKQYCLRGCGHIVKVVLSDDAMLCNLNYRKLGYFKFGDESWTMIGDEGQGKFSSYADIIYHKQKFYVIDFTGRIIVVDSSLRVEVFISPVRVVGILEKWYFVQSCGDLFVLKKYYDLNGARALRLPLFKVYRLNIDGEEWSEVTNLGDQTFFIGDGCTFSISAEQFSGCGKNLIYCADMTFARKEDGTYNTGEPGFDVGVINLNENSSRPLHTSIRHAHIFWPIPLWLK